MGTEFEASNPYDSESLARLRKRLIVENINRAHTADFDEYYDRTGEMPTSIAQLWSPYPTEQLYDLTAPEMSTVGLPVVGPGDWAARDDFAAVYAAVDPGNDDTGEWESYKACHADGFGGYWMVDARPIDPAFARTIVEDAMAREGMKPRGGTGV